tara:strand:- start:781 stop:1161 length:381 start_codon:yes stop_codon:yes gene_type:complete
MKEFMKKTFANRIQTIWMQILMLFNIVIPIFFFQSLEAKVALLCMLIALSLGLFLFKLKGYTRLLGLMHFPWIGLIIFLIYRIPRMQPGLTFGIWVIALIVLNSVSLIYDITDVVKYMAGQREELR